MAFNRIQIKDQEDNIIFEGMICFLPLKEEVVLKRCRDYYKQEVCTLRKETMKRTIYLEIERALELQSLKDKPDIFVELPMIVRDMLSYTNYKLTYRFFTNIIV